MQARWKRRHALVEAGPAGKLGRRGLPYQAIFQIVLPLAAPTVDVIAVNVWGSNTRFGCLK